MSTILSQEGQNKNTDTERVRYLWQIDQDIVKLKSKEIFFENWHGTAGFPYMWIWNKGNIFLPDKHPARRKRDVNSVGIQNGWHPN